ncbi:MAG: TIGR03088 family PEP-CTERM/XrtA system glycosyltransferase [Burkholderiaceae bacterium]|nr:TIGR03088 family PEP-CTERM/XrtA system glycosyltransferase [Burkholderiaceae bacterium]
MKAGAAHLVHVIHRFDTGGMENGLVNLVNRLPASRFRHTIVPLTNTGRIAARITNPQVRVEPLLLQPGPLARALPTLWRMLRRLRPSIVHTRNVGTLEVQIAALLAGVPVRIHGEHGWEVHDLVGSNASLLRTRRLLRHFVHAQVALSAPTLAYLRDRVGVPSARLHSICNGVDTDCFRPRTAGEQSERRHATTAEGGPRAIIVGYVGRLADVKNPLLIVDAFEQLHAQTSSHDRALATHLRLRIIGDGPLAGALHERIGRSPLRDRIERIGMRDDIAVYLRDLDIYALPSLAEGISNTLLEAMASGLPCVATSVGGNAELIEDGTSGTLVASNDANAMAAALGRYARDERLREAHGACARTRAVERFGIDRMITDYEALYTRLLLHHRVVEPAWAAAPTDRAGALARSGTN